MRSFVPFFERYLHWMLRLIDCCRCLHIQIIDTGPPDFEFPYDLKLKRKKISKYLHWSSVKVRAITLSIRTSIFCSAKRRAIHDRMPCPNGNTKYGFVCTFDVLSLFLSQRSGLNFSGDSKCLSKRQEMKFWVTVMVCNKLMNSIFGFTHRYAGNTFTLTPFGTL